MALNTKHSYANRFYAHLTDAISSDATSLSFYPEEITNLLAGWNAGTWLYLCIMDDEGNLEIVKMTAISGPTLTVERGQGGTSAQAWNAGALVACRAVAEYLTRYPQRGVFRSGAYNPNDTLTGEYTGEKFYQTGPDAAQRRWWINTTGTKWRLLTGSVFGIEYADDEGYIIKPSGWQLVALAGEAGALRSLCEFNGKLYAGADYYGTLYEWDGADTLVPKAFTAGNYSVAALLVFNSKLYCAAGGYLWEWNNVDDWLVKSGYATVSTLETDGTYIYGAGSDGKLYRWNNVNAWVQVAAKYQDGIQRLIYFEGTLYGATYFIFLGVGGRLFNWTGLAWGVAAGKYDSDRNCRDACEFNGKLYAIADYATGALLEWDEASAWVDKGQGDPPDGYSTMIAMVEHQGILYVNHSKSTPGWQGLSQWNGTDALVEVIADPTDPPENFYDLISFGGCIYGAGTQGNLWRYQP